MENTLSKFIKNIMNTIAMDKQPFWITSDQGFIDLFVGLEPSYLTLSTKYFIDTMLFRLQ